MPAPLPPAEFVAKATEQGFVFSVKPDGKIGVKPPASGMTDGVRRYVSSMKSELLALLVKQGDLQGLAGTSEAPSRRLPISEFSEYPGPLTPPPFVARGAKATHEELERFCAWARREAELMGAL
jgi:hypothetical protein